LRIGHNREPFPALLLQLANPLIGLEIVLVGKPLEEHQGQDVGLVILAGSPAAEDIRGTPEMGFQLLLRQARHERTFAQDQASVNSDNSRTRARCPSESQERWGNDG
jgi:hypothetical protein